MKIDLSCPIQILCAEIREDGEGTLHWLNMGAKTISSVEFMIETETGRGKYRVMDMNAPQGGRYEIAFPVPDTRQGQEASGVVERVWFADASVWRRDPNATHIYKQNALAPGRALDQLCFVAGQDAVCYPSEQEPLWVCVCGGVNHQDANTCCVCGRDRAGTFECYSEEAVAEAVQRREKEMNEQAQRAVRESSEREQARMLLERRRKRRRRVIAVSVMIALLVVGFGAFYAMEGKNLLPYLYGQWLCEQGEFDKARDTFANLGEYRDAVQLSEEAEYSAAIALTQSEKAQEVEAGIARLEAIPSAEAIEAAAQSRIVLAARYEAQDKMAEAEALLLQVANYPETVDPLRRVSYQLALDARAAGDYAQAADRLALLDDYEDAAALFTACQYDAAKSAMDEEDYEGAIARFATVLEHEQAEELTRECVYQFGQQLALESDYAGAAEKFAMLGAYRDSADRLKDSYYRMGLLAMEEGEYQEALSSFAQAGDYMDAQALYDECVMPLAQVHIDNAEYAAAAQLLKTATSEEAKGLWKKTVYTLAEILWNEEDYGKAAEWYEALGQYEDAAARADLARVEEASALREIGEYQAAIAIYEALGEDYGAADLLKECRYELAQYYEKNGAYADAQETYSMLGGYKDSARRTLSCGYAYAKSLLEAADYESACTAFMALTGYADASAQADAAADAWLGDAAASADAALEEKDYDKVIDLLAPYAQKELPAKYAHLSENYKEANYTRANELIAAEDRLGALPYLRAIEGYKNVDKLLSHDTYRLLGKWLTADGVLAQFMEDGTCIIGGEAGQYRVSGYSILIGAGEESFTRAYSMISLNHEKLTIKREQDGTTLRFTREKEE